jgi:hypothetical protein
MARSATVVLLGLVMAVAIDAADAQTPGTLQGELIAVGPGAASITLALPSPLNQRDLALADPTAKIRLLQASQGDAVVADVDNTANPQTITKLDKLGRPVPAWSRIVALGIALAVLALLAAIATRWKPLGFLIGADNRYSNSQCQLALWFGAVATVYVATIFLRIIYLGWDYVGGVGITQNVAALTGLSALSFGGAKVITVQKIDAAAQHGQTQIKTPAANPNLLTDLVLNDQNHPDLGDFQMILIALAAVGIFALSAFHMLGSLEMAPTVTLPDVDSTLLASFGIGQGAYLVKKAASKLGEG